MNSDELYEENQALATYVLSKCFNLSKSSEYYEDFLQTAMMALFTAAKTYDEEQGCKFSTYACRIIFTTVATFYMSLTGMPRVKFFHRAEFGDYLNGKKSLDELIEICGENGYSPARVMSAIYHDDYILSLDDKLGADEDDETTLGDITPANLPELDRDLICNEAIEYVLNRHQGTRSSKDVKNICNQIWLEWIVPRIFENGGPTGAELARKYHKTRGAISNIIWRRNRTLLEYIRM